MHPAAPPARRPSGPLTLADWRAAVRSGASLTQLVHERLAQAVQPGGDAAWILPPDAPAMRAHIAARLAELEALAAAAPDRGTLLAQRPLFGVPFVGSVGLFAVATLLFITINLAIGFAFSTLAQNQLHQLVSCPPPRLPAWVACRHG